MIWTFHLIVLAAIFSSAEQDYCSVLPPGTPPALYINTTDEPLWQTAAHLLAILLNETESVSAHVGTPFHCDSDICIGDSNTSIMNDTTFPLQICGSASVLLIPMSPAQTRQYANDRLSQSLEDLGDVMPEVRRECIVKESVADKGSQSLYTLVKSDVARETFYLSNKEIKSFCREDIINTGRCNTDNPILSFNESSSAQSIITLFTSERSDARAIASTLGQWGVKARVVSLGAARAAELALQDSLQENMLLCLWRPPQNYTDARALLSPYDPLSAKYNSSTFQFKRLAKIVNIRYFIYKDTAKSALKQFELTNNDLIELSIMLKKNSYNYSETAIQWWHKNKNRFEQWLKGQAHIELKMMLLTPFNGARRAYRGSALLAGAYMTDKTKSRTKNINITFTMGLHDSKCSKMETSFLFFLYTTLWKDDFKSFTGIIGPACGEAVNEARSRAAMIGMPILSYTEGSTATGSLGEGEGEGEEEGKGKGSVVLGAGSWRQTAAALRSALGHWDWHRATFLLESGTRELLEQFSLQTNLTVKVHSAELQEIESKPTVALLVKRWAQEVNSAKWRIIVLWLEEEGWARSALCAGLEAGLGPTAGFVWLLRPALIPALLTQPQESDPIQCSRQQLEQMLEGHLSVGPSWIEEPVSDAGWTDRWRRACLYLKTTNKNSYDLDECKDTPKGHAALLYDLMRQWQTASVRLLTDVPSALNHLQTEENGRLMLSYIKSQKYVGMTGPFVWRNDSSGILERESAHTVWQWQGGRRRPVLLLSDAPAPLHTAEVQWAGGAQPSDGTEHCAGLDALMLQLGTNCLGATMVVVTACIAALLLCGACGGVVLRRRLERRFRAKLATYSAEEAAALLAGWELPRSRVVIEHKLGQGAFATVYRGRAMLVDAQWTEVAVKLLEPGASVEEKLDFLAEAESMKRLEHDNIVRMLGVVTKSEPMCTVIELMLYGDLKSYLLSRRSPDGCQSISPAQLTLMARHVAQALVYLAEKRFVHRDVAARNCLVSADHVVKLADFGMTRAMIDSEYYRFNRRGLLPLRWMAPECLNQGTFTPASDVWSYGVLLYEIVTFGAPPYRGLSNETVLQRVKEARALDPPDGLKPQLLGLMRRCWQKEARERPAAWELVEFLTKYPELLTACLTEDCAFRHELKRSSSGGGSSAGTDSTALSEDLRRLLYTTDPKPEPATLLRYSSIETDSGYKEF